MTPVSESVLFLSSFAPLFGVFALLDSFGAGWPSTLCLALMIVGLAAPFVLGPVIVSKLANDPLRIQSAQSRDGDALAYVATYLVPFAAFAASTTRERLALLLFVVVVAIVYVRSHLFYVNPLFAIVGYRLFQISTPEGASVVLVTPRRFIPANEVLQARRVGSYIWWEAKK